ncbi:MAG: restriction endonuclease, SacI family [Cellvibrionaceae bacterium]
MKISSHEAKDILLQEAENEKNLPIDQAWRDRIDAFSRTCEETSKTHIAFLGTALLAKCVNLAIDAYSVKAGDDSDGAYSARGLAHGVLVPQAPRLNINLGVTGREPLNNQPYFRIKRITRDVPVRGNAQIAIDSLIDLLEIINTISSQEDARNALRAFIHIRRQYSPSYAALDDNAPTITLDELIGAVSQFVSENSEGGKRAQAVVAGLLDLYAGPDRVLSGRINDPDRHLPGDVGIRKKDNPEEWEKVFEVRDKSVSSEDVYLFVQKATENNVSEAAVISAHASQDKLNINDIKTWAKERNVTITFYLGWHDFINQVVFWSEVPHLEGLKIIPKLVYERLIEIEASEEAVKKWVSIFN